MTQRAAWALSLCMLVPAEWTHGQEAPPADVPPTAAPAVPARPFLRPVVPRPLFTHTTTVLLEPECERIATWLARYAAREFTAGVLRGDAEAQARGRLFLTISSHLQPRNVSAVHCANRWAEGKVPDLAPPAEDGKIFVAFLMSATGRLQQKGGPHNETLARVLTRLAADLDPENTEAVLASELQDQQRKTPPFKQLLDGTIGQDWSTE